MREIRTSEEDGMLVLSTPELDGYMYLPLNNGKANVSLLDENACQKTFCCNDRELKDYLKKKGY